MPSDAVRAAVAADGDQIRSLAIDNGMFAPDEMSDFDEAFAAYLGGTADDARWIVAEGENGSLDAAAFYAPEPFGDRVWNLFFLAVRPGVHRGGTGTSLVQHIERTLGLDGETVARVLIVETSSTDAYKSARAFYERNGFTQEAVIRQFYGVHDDKVVYWKSLVSIPD